MTVLKNTERDTALTWFSRVINAMSSCKRRFSRSAISRLRPASVSSSLLASSWWRRLIISRSFAAIVSFWRLVHMHKFGNIFTITHGILISSDSYNEVAIFKYVYCANWHIPVFFLSFFLSFFLYEESHAPHVPVLRPASWAGPMHDLRGGTSVV